MRNKLIDKAIGMVGSQQKLAEICNVKQPSVWAWLHGKKKPSATSAKRIELATNGVVQASKLRPDLHEIFS
ncbi:MULTISPECIES: transcriptional regulator [Proteus]|uniref:transcriptional regulator n=1 Tax=Proteus TaxID=583 RepID=UPI000D74BCFA|nr:YdaS family helix-turn-helix protein [Proteus mirabilis]AWR59151.1 transcriptional regulator [Proteus mirabilis]ELA7642792.1 helix-turn-helix domain-containing protein [Proteus mirabilis]ELA7950964.1 helix-turn-helix domain-containing protein [Proteus mirabilis]ELZ9636749.1 helix-turn-helix domain-containing protein [Proteus mirabilis]MBG2779431.1 helix-turn-helix domain-containing protein [Proteus mirabilis]